MTASDWVAVAIAVVVAIATGGLLVALGALMRTMTAVQLTIDELRKETLPLVTDVRKAIEEGRETMRKREAELRAELELRQPR